MKALIVPSFFLIFLGIVLVTIVLESQVIFEPELQPDEILPYGAITSFNVFAFIGVWFSCLLCSASAWIAMLTFKN